MITWILLFKVNAWLFASVEVNSNVSWVFLPAFLRMFAAMLWGWTAAAGLFVGALVTSSIWTGGTVIHAVATAAISALGPLLGVRICRKLLGLNVCLENIKAHHILQFAATGALVNTVLHGFYFYAVGKQPTLMGAMLPMLVGDLLGSLIILYLASTVLQLVSRLKR